MSEKGNLYKNKGFWHKVSRLSIRKKMNFVGLLVVGIFALILFLRVLPLLEKGKLEERRGKLRAVVNSVTSLMDYYERSIRSRAWENDPSMPKTIEEAKKLVIKNIRQMRYDKTEYFFIMDGKGNMVMHPLKPELEGKNLMDKKDPDGNLIFREMVLNSQRDSEAFVSYVWQSKYSPIIFEPQTTYARYFWAWDWVVCSGVYTQDILDSMKEINYLSAGYIVATSALTVVLLFGFVYFNLTKPLTRLLMAIEEISKNNLDYKVQPFFDDELGHISEQFNEMVQHRKRSQEELTQLNASLEDKVIQRTSELSDSLKQVNALKVQQDGDYFLTALLVKPLQSEQNESKRIVTKSHIEQYKQFVFRKWKNEIGGDICITDNIVLNGRDYVFFVNADAMGKSIQGAGGVLLFGASVKAHLIQTKAGKTFTALPELWLKNLYLDLNQLFKTFDGSMLISAAIGLIDELTGVMYYLNAEHPWPVLYRDGVASFLEDNLSLRKVGTPGEHKIDLGIQTFKLGKGDRVILGSDGRDDIMIKDASGKEEMNYDETLFLKTVEKSGGDLQNIIENIRNTGRIKDDLSLLVIDYNASDFKLHNEMKSDESSEYYKALEKYNEKKYDESLSILRKTFNGKPFYSEVYNLFLNIYTAQKDYLRKSNILMNYFSLAPNDSSVITDIVISLKSCGQYDLAADYGEALRLRNPYDINTLILLSEIYRTKGLHYVALRRLEDALKISPENPDVVSHISAIQNEIEKNLSKKDKEIETQEVNISFEY